MATRQPQPGRWGSEDLPADSAGDRPSPRSDSPLVQRAVSRGTEGDLEGLHFLYLRYAPDVLRCVAGAIDDQDAAEEITQGVFAELKTALGGYDEQQKGPFGAWILGVARNAAADRRRSSRPR